VIDVDCRQVLPTQEAGGFQSAVAVFHDAGTAIHHDHGPASCSNRLTP
jgi:hypothetical protein